MNSLTGTVANETIAYFMARIQKFLILVGVDPNRLRFRQVKTPKQMNNLVEGWTGYLSTEYPG